jgi:AcrR family transcriptional regulator
MSPPPTRRAVKRSYAALPTTKTIEREPRGARRKRETRSRLLEAALELMAERGMEGVAINEITEAADVGFGSFYNHFESKEAIYDAVVEWTLEEFGDRLDRLVSEISDPAEVITVSVRHALMRAQRDPTWGKFLMREGFSARALERGLGRRLLRDFQRGIAAKRFTAADSPMTFVSLRGTVLGAIALELQLASPQGKEVAILRELGFNFENGPERIAATLLQMLGLSRTEAERIANRPLPPGGRGSGTDPFARQVRTTTRSAQVAARRRKKGSQRTGAE